MKPRTAMLIVLGIPLAILGAVWFSLSPTVTPDDVELTGIIKETMSSPEPRIPTDQKAISYVFEIELNSKTKKRLNDYEQGYFFTVYPYVDGYEAPHWDLQL